jgi:2-keto-4-pentenoate hydratase/2-oxohepta-3-ene-1,7-dioic acid hydratase in catechol pathway
MRIVNVDGRLGLIGPDGAVTDVESASNGEFSSDPQDVYEHWDSFRSWAESSTVSEAVPAPEASFGAPAPRPRQVFGIGLNYREHAAEAGIELPAVPLVFAKFAAAVTGPFAEIELPRGSVDYEAELVVVMGRPAHRVPESRAWEYVAGLTAGQDLSERELQLAPPTPQFSLGKSFPGFAPTGPVLVSPDELGDPDDLELTCSLNGEQVQQTRTSDLIFPVPAIIAYLSSVLPLYPGDVIFTGTPSGTGWARTPKKLLQPGDVLTTSVKEIGAMRNTFTAASR